MPQLKPDVPGLSATDLQLIKQEHARLKKFLCDLRDTCGELETAEDCQLCSREKIAACQGRLPSFFHDFLDIISEHFENEENIMRNVLHEPDNSEYFRQHLEEHRRLMHVVKTQISVSSTLTRQGNVSEAIRQFHQRVTEIMYEHEPRFDHALLNSRHRQPGI